MTTLTTVETGETARFLLAVFGRAETGYVHIYRKSNPGMAFVASAPPDRLDELAEQLTDRTGDDLYVACALQPVDRFGPKQRNTKDTATSITALWADFDRAGEPGHKTDGRLWTPEDFDKLIDYMTSIGVPPSIVVDSGGGWHVWMVLEKPAEIGTGRPEELIARWRRFISDMADRFDRHVDSVVELGRILRVPGTFNQKGQPARLARIDTFTDRTYSFGDLDDMLPLPEPVPDLSSTIVDGKRPGDKFNLACRDNPDLLVDLLSRHGFHSPTSVTGFRTYRIDMVRPGKTANDGYSVSVFADTGTVTVWSTAPEVVALDLQDRTYSPFSLVTLLDHGGDPKAAAQALIDDGYTAEPVPTVPDVEPVSDTLAGTLDALDRYYDEFVHFENADLRHAVVLWTAHTWGWDLLDLVAYLFIHSPEKRCGKSTLLDCIYEVVRGPLMASSITPSVVFRLLEREPRTLLIDEVDMVFPKRKSQADPSKMELQSLLDGGYQRGRPAWRTVGRSFEPQSFDPFGPKAFAGIGDALPDTVVDRSIQITLQRKPRHLRKGRNRKRIREAAAAPIKAALAEHVPPLAPKLANTFLDLPDLFDDRAEDIWEPLVVLADEAGSVWPARARAAARNLTIEKDNEDTLGVQLLADVLTVWPADDLSIGTKHLNERLSGLDESPWSDWFGRDFNPRDLAKLLKPFGIRSAKVWDPTDGKSVQGYKRDDFAPIWDRYLVPVEEGTEGPEGSPETPMNTGVSTFRTENDLPEGDPTLLVPSGNLPEGEKRPEGENPNKHGDPSPPSTPSVPETQNDLPIPF